MCGIVGVLSLNGHPISTEPLIGMVDAMSHRGPDGAGYYVGGPGGGDGQAFADSRYPELIPDLPLVQSEQGRKALAHDRYRVFLGHRRLAVIDLTHHSHQPMTDEHGRWLIYNGEIYNHPELRRELQGLGDVFSSRGDAEVLLRSFMRWGTDAIRLLNGMFAFALWDARAATLTLARDRYGIKPLYYYRDDSVLVFASEIKAMLPYLDQKPDVDMLALNEYFSFQNVLSDRTLFQGIRILEPGHYLQVNIGNNTTIRQRYWDFDFNDEMDMDAPDIEQELVRLIDAAVRRQCRCDVPVGCYLSGGMDSGTIAALASSQLGILKSFTMGSDISDVTPAERSFDERLPARLMATTFGTEHHESVLEPGDIPENIHRIVWHMEDLRIGQSYPNYCVARLAGNAVKVVMSGVGGDELFGGYPWRYAAAMGSDSEAYLANYYRYWQRLVSGSEKTRLFRREIRERHRHACRASGWGTFDDHTFAVFQKTLNHGHGNPQSISAQARSSLYFECKTFLHGLLVVEDKLSMAHSLETRLPFLDNDLVDFACRIPVEMKISGVGHRQASKSGGESSRAVGQAGADGGKIVLRSAMRGILPGPIFNAGKQGFSAPDASWFRGHCRDYVRDTLQSPNSALNSYLNPDYVAEVLQAHNEGRTNNRLLIWSLLCFESWLNLFS